MNRTKSYIIPVVVTITLHALLLLMLGWGWQSTPPEKVKKQQLSYVKAKIVKLKESRPQKTKKAKTSDTKKKAKAEKQRKKERQRKAEKEKKRKAEQKQRKAKQKKKQQEAEKRKKAEAEKKRQADKEKKRKEEEARLQEEQRRLETQQQLSDALAEEEEFLQEASDEQQAQSYLSVIQQAIERQWSRPPSARNNMEVELVIKLIPTGQVVNVSVARSSGNSAFDRSAINAVKKAERFPELQQLKGAVFERYFRSVKIIFRPEDLRQ